MHANTGYKLLLATSNRIACVFAGLQESAYVPPVQTPYDKEWQQVGKQTSLHRQLAAAGQDGLQSESSDDFGGAQSVRSIDSNAPLLARLTESTSLSRDQLVEGAGGLAHSGSIGCTHRPDGRPRARNRAFLLWPISTRLPPLSRKYGQAAVTPSRRHFQMLRKQSRGVSITLAAQDSRWMRRR